MSELDPKMSPQLVDIEMPGVATEVVKEAIDAEVASTSTGRIAGVIVAIGGLILSFLGFTGAVQWSFEISGVSSTLKNASPGIVCVVAGLLTLLASRPAVRIRGTSSVTRTQSERR